MSRPSIAHVITGLDTGGAEAMLLRLLAATDGSRWQQGVVSLRDRGPIGQRIQQLGVSVGVIGIRGSVPTPGALWRLRRELRQLAPSLIQGWMYHGNLASLVGRILSGRRLPVLWNIRYAPSDLSMEKRTTATVIRLGALLSSRATRIIYNSRTGARRHAELGYATGSSVIIPNGFDTDAFAPSASARAALRRRLGVSEATLLVGRIGRNDPVKDHAGFLEAAALLLRERPGIRFVMAGQGVDDRNAELTRTLKGLGLGDSVSLLGEVTAINEVTAALDIACSSSYLEAFPNILGEAMACGVPCVATDVGDSAWIVGDAGRVVPARDPGALATACRALIDIGEEGRRHLGAQARARVLQEFSLSRASAAYEAVYAEVLQ
jgi:glycosyltransferase involved in cell wall biosynthesis